MIELSKENQVKRMSMLIVWILRASILVSLFIIAGASGYFFRNRETHPTLVESKIFNGFVVIWYCAGCFLTAGLLPPDPGVFTKPTILLDSTITLVFPIVGILCIAVGLLLDLYTMRQRRVLGMQNTHSGLVTSGAYATFRHPMYVGIICISLGIVLITQNWDGMIVFPLIALVNLIEARSEENNDLYPRFGKEYERYRNKVRVFGPLWFWLVWVLPIAVLVVMAAI